MSAASKKTQAAKQADSQQATDLVFGLGKTGLSVARYLARCGRHAVYADSRDTPPGLDELKAIAPDADVVLGKASADLPDGIGRVIVSPGLADREPLLVAAREKGVEILSDIELFVREAKAPFVAVTGSNGKSTVTTLIALMCEAAGKRALAGANLGVPALDLLLEETPDFYVLELSSFQLQRTKHLPARAAVLLNISPDHLDWHGSVQEYRDAKYRIFAEAETAVFNREDPEAQERVGSGKTYLSFGLDTPGEGQYGIRSEDGVDFLARGEQLLLATSEMVLVGEHNYANALAALAAGQLLGLDLPSMLQVLVEFPGLPHRMQHIRNLHGVDYINDSKATNVGAAIASVRSVPGPIVLIAGGQGKGGDFEQLASSIHDKLRLAILIGEDAERIAKALEGLAEVRLAGGMAEALNLAREQARSGDTVLLAPACASFDQFDNYMHRGDVFAQLVRELH
ncbi:MAG: UDP-N-acetylmuramoyl-L-alanine--D-glutamate ligase [Gammaproteobacteria bacterium]|nr:UDP-N-acetylmuramoyl-L-alanine--D-glutamate ligase [Gammaproteobacteria bacterium]MDH4253790.1 UDP-N-acetylmuramoyl-L-alanine--D-glutamate ligase [Gammaproteobacteria bacterium]MDH5308637.1 UDP-N-acetylmuramoyl-L-alanine--D-glutamate ligase [Gammaproteobacteria bacterium]